METYFINDVDGAWDGTPGQCDLFVQATNEDEARDLWAFYYEPEDASEHKLRFFIIPTNDGKARTLAWHDNNGVREVAYEEGEQ